MTSTMTAADGGTELGTVLARLGGACLLGAGAIHLAGAPVHTGHDASIGAFFWVVGVAELLLGVGLLVRGGRPLALVAGASSAAVIALWVVSRTVGVAGLSTPAAAEGVEVADAVATGLEVAWSSWSWRSCGRRCEAAGSPRGGARSPSPPWPWSSARWPPPPPWPHPITAAAPTTTGVEMRPTTMGASQAAAADHPTADHPDASQAAAADHHGAEDEAAAGDGEHESTAFVFGEESHHSAESCDPTAEEQAAADRLLTHTKDGLARLSDIDVARNEGYMRYGDVAISGTWHYINWEYQADTDVLDPTKPESIVYWQSGPDAPMILIGAMYVMPTVDDLGPQVGGCLTRWHTHGEPFAPKGALTNEMLHVWTVPLPNGPFV